MFHVLGYNPALDDSITGQFNLGFCFDNPAAKGPRSHGALPDRWEAWHLRRHEFWSGGGALYRRYRLNLLPKAFDGLQLILSHYIENELEMVRFKVNDTYVIPKRPLLERTMLIRHKERKFGKGCVREWTTHRRYLCTQFLELLEPIDNMLAASPFLLTDRPLFVDYDLYGVLGNCRFNDMTRLSNLEHLRRWYRAMRSDK
jgi:glutathione S-transferase